MSKKGFAYIFICLFLFQALNGAYAATPMKFRGQKGLAHGYSQSNRDYGKHYALPSNKVLARKGAGGSQNGSKGKSNNDNKNNSKNNNNTNNNGNGDCGCQEKKKQSVHNNFNRAYETIGLCQATIDVVRNTEKCVDFIATQCFSVQTLREHNTKYNVLRDTQANQRFVACFGATIERLTNVCKTVQTLVPISVSIDIVATQDACVQTLSARNACVKTLREIKKNARYIQSQKACARRVTGAGGKIKAIHRVHQRVSQEISRSVTCGSGAAQTQCAPAPTQCAPAPTNC